MAVTQKSLPGTSEATSISHKKFKPPLFHIKVFFNVFMRSVIQPPASASGTNTKAASGSREVKCPSSHCNMIPLCSAVCFLLVLPHICVPGLPEKKEQALLCF